MEQRTDSTRPNSNHQETHSSIVIDLNATPPSPSPPPTAFSVVCSFHAHPPLPPGSPATIPRGGGDSSCPACGEAGEGGGHVVCDGCERGFHVGCAGIGRTEAVEEEWLCEECLSKGVVSSRWKLGSKTEGLGKKCGRVESLDVNGSTCVDGGEEGSEGFLDSRYEFRAFFSFLSSVFCGSCVDDYLEEKRSWKVRWHS